MYVCMYVCMYVFRSLKQCFYNEKIAMINNVEPAYKTQIKFRTEQTLKTELHIPFYLSVHAFFYCYKC